MTGKEDREILDVMDHEDLFVSTEERKELHRKGLLHRAVHVFILDGQGKIYLQKRALTKDQNPGKWDSSASGHVDSGESYPDAAVRELQEELGVRIPLIPMKKVVACEQTDGEHSMLYMGILDPGSPRPEPNPEEILEGRFFSLEEIKNKISNTPSNFTSSFCILFEWFYSGGGGHSPSS